MIVETNSDTATPTSRDGAARAAVIVRRRLTALRLLSAGLANYSAIAVWAVMVGVFAATIPHLFLTRITLRTLLSDQAVTGLLAVAALIPLAAGVVDLAFAAIAGYAMVVCTWLTIHSGFNGVEVTLITMCAALSVGAVSVVFVTVLRVNSLVATLGTSAIAGGLTSYVSGGQTLTGRFSPSFAKVGGGRIGEVAYPFLYLIILMGLVWAFLEYTGAGRRLLAVGGNPTAARLAGIRVARVETATLLASAAIAGFAGVILATSIGQSTDQTGGGYLLPALAGVFLGSTQVRQRVNVVGTFIAVYMLGTGVKGLQLSGAQPWVSSLFNGAALLVAVGLAAHRHRAQT